MELTDITHVDPRNVATFKPDLIIAASGFESRSSCIPALFLARDCERVALGFRESSRAPSRLLNDRFFRKENYREVLCHAHEAPNFEEILGKRSAPGLNILFDITVMTRMWYHSFLKFMHQPLNFDSVTARMAYCPAYYSDPIRFRKGVELKSISHLESGRKTSSNKKRTALILGMGNEPQLCSKIRQKVNPDTTYLLYADPAIEREYVENVFINNHEIIRQIPIRNLVGYPLTEPGEIYKSLIDLILPLRNDHRIMIAPQGPKIFSLMAMVSQISYPDIELLYPMFRSLKTRDRKPTGKHVAVDLVFERD